MFFRQVVNVNDVVVFVCETDLNQNDNEKILFSFRSSLILVNFFLEFFYRPFVHFLIYPYVGT